MGSAGARKLVARFSSSVTGKVALYGLSSVSIRARRTISRVQSLAAETIDKEIFVNKTLDKSRQIPLNYKNLSLCPSPRPRVGVSTLSRRAKRSGLDNLRDIKRLGENCGCEALVLVSISNNFYHLFTPPTY